MRPAYYFALAAVPLTQFTRYAIVAGDGETVLDVQISVPDLVEIERPAVLRWRRPESAEVRIRELNRQEFVIRAGEQPRKPVWSRANRRAVAEVAP